MYTGLGYVEVTQPNHSRGEFVCFLSHARLTQPKAVVKLKLVCGSVTVFACNVATRLPCRENQRDAVFNLVSNVCKDSLSFKMPERIRRQILLVNSVTRMNEALYTVFKALGTEVISCWKVP